MLSAAETSLGESVREYGALPERSLDSARNDKEAPPCPPVRKRAISSMGFCVADNPMRVTGPSAR